MSGDIHYFPKPLEAERVDQVFPVVREVAHSLTIEAWRDYALQLLERSEAPWPSRGIVLLEGDRRYVRGLFAYLVVPTLEGGRTLEIDYLAVPEAIDRRKIAFRLIRTARHCAERQGCHSIRAKLQKANRWLAELLAETGYVEEQAQTFQLPGPLPRNETGL